MLKKIVLSAVIFSLAAGLSACTVMQSTYKKKMDEADAAAKRLAALQEKHVDLVAENDGLKDRIDRLLSELEEMALQKEKLTTDLAYVSDQRDKLASEREEGDLVRKMEELASENDRLRRECAAPEKPKE